MSCSTERIHGEPKVSVIVPAFNAEATLADTLRSIRAQSLRDFEVIVIDDGSTDATSQIAQRFVAEDPRVRLITQTNSGVADARNAGIRAARAPFVAPIDADDIWHPWFLEKTYAAMISGGEDIQFAFANFRRLDLEGRIVGSGAFYDLSGYAFNRLLVKNFVGNGSGMMFRRDAALAVGGYERRLQHEFGAAGCEDWLLQLRLAGRGSVHAVGEYLVGYRRVPGAMSSNQVKMLQSRIHAFEIAFAELGCRDTLGARWGLGRALAECLIHRFRAGQIRASCRMLPRAFAVDARGTLDAILKALRGSVSQTLRHCARPALKPLKQWLRGRREELPFFECDPRANRRLQIPGLLTRRMIEMEALDRSASEPGSGAVAATQCPAAARQSELAAGIAAPRGAEPDRVRDRVG